MRAERESDMSLIEQDAHDQSIIDRYVNQGALKLIRDYSDGDSAKINWALYRLACR